MQTTETTTVKAPATPDEVVEAIKADLATIELGVLTEGYTLADAIREGAGHTAKGEGLFVEGTTSCTLGAAYLSAKARGLAS